MKTPHSDSAAISRADKANLVMERLRTGEISLQGEEREACIFWLGGVAASTDEDSLVLLELVALWRLTLSEARTGEPLKWIRAVTYLQRRDGVRETIGSALQKWQDLSPLEREVLLETYAREVSRVEKPSSRDRRRLESGAEALALEMPTTPDEIRDQLEILGSAIANIKSLGDLGSREAHDRAEYDLQRLLERQLRFQRTLGREF